MTITSAATVARILRNGGEEEGFKFPLIYAYTDGHNNRMYALFTSPEYDDVAVSPWVKDYTCLMANGILTKEGQSFLDRNK